MPEEEEEMPPNSRTVIARAREEEREEAASAAAAAEVKLFRNYLCKTRTDFVFKDLRAAMINWIKSLSWGFFLKKTIYIYFLKMDPTLKRNGLESDRFHPEEKYSH